jgi:hypothetical protein
MIEMLINNIMNLLNINDTTKGIVLIIIHNISILLILLYIIFGNINYLYYGLIILLVIIFIINIIYKGCPLIQLERKYIKNNKWYGSYHLLELINIYPNKRNMIYLSYIWCLVFIVIITYRFYK